MLSLDANTPFPSYAANGSVYYPKNAPLMNPNLANTTTWFSEGVSSFNALELDVTRRFTKGLQLRGAYTFSKSLDNGTAWNSSVASNAPGFVMFPLNPKWDYGLSTTDVRHLATINGTYELPFGRGKRFLSNAAGWHDKLASGWSISAIQSVQSGLPFTPQLGFNPTNNGDSRNPIRPSWNPAFAGKLILGSPSLYFDPNAFVTPASGTYGNVGRDTMIGPGIVSLDASLIKNTSVTERLRVQFRAEFFNALNHANLSTPNPVVFTAANTAPSPTAGVVTATSTTSRQVQFGLKLLF
jgi:hypothetical protein